MTSIFKFQVGTVVLYGIPIVSLVIESQERLCLAQISNTLLKQFSYNEIHNRRVALGKGVRVMVAVDRDRRCCHS